MPKAQEGENDLTAMPGLQIGSLFDVQGKVVLITGGGSGIGAMIAMGFASNGAKVYIASRKDTTAFASQVTHTGPGSCHSLNADLITDEGVAALADEIMKLEPRGINVLVNNSGTNWSAPLSEYDGRAWDKVYALNVKAVFMLSKFLVPSLEAAVQRTGCHSSIINISSIDSKIVSALETYAYGSGKAAVCHLSRQLAGALGPKKITCNSILPGPFPSRMMRGTIQKVSAKGVARGTTIGRLGCPGDMAGVSLFLASRAGSFVTGAEVIVDGGSLCKPRM